MVSRGEVWGIIPARGGSKSISMKNLHPLAGRPLIDYVIAAAQRSASLSWIVCSTDHEKIASHCRSFNLAIQPRPESLAGDATRMEDVFSHLIRQLNEEKGRRPDAVVMLLPTSPFMLPFHIDATVGLLLSHPEANSAQTVTRLPHHYHAFNQRLIESGAVRFVFPEQRRKGYNKQAKPTFFSFGNVLVTRTDAFLRTGDLFAPPSLPIEIDPYHSLDVDGFADFDLAEWYLQTGRVQLPVDSRLRAQA